MGHLVYEGWLSRAFVTCNISMFYYAKEAKSAGGNVDVTCS